jgi:hypothetical protein
VGELKVLGLLNFVALVCVWAYFCCSGGGLCQDFRGLGLCAVGTVGYSAGDEYVGGRVSVVKG